MHYYDEEGKPQHYQTVKSGIRKGKRRGTTVTDAKKLGLVPSVTTILDILDKGDGLTGWKIKQAIAKLNLLHLNWLRRLSKMFDSRLGFCNDFIRDFNIDTDYKERDYAEEGTVIHDAIEKWIGSGMQETDNPYCLVAKEVFEKFGVTDPISEQSFATSEYGGSVDIHDRVNNVIIDWKTKDGNLFEKKAKSMVYDTHLMQLTSYREGLGLPSDTKLVNVFLSRTHPETYCCFEHTDEKDLTRAAKMFSLCKELWYTKNRIDR